MTRNNPSQRARALRIASAVGAGALVVGMITVGAAVADSGSSDIRKSVTAPGAKKSREATPVRDGAPKKSREASPVRDGAPKKSREASPVLDGAPRKSREATPVLDGMTPKKSREAAPTS